VADDIRRYHDDDGGLKPRTGAVPPTNKEHPVGSKFKRFITFYFTNFSAQFSNFYFRKGFEVYGMLEDVVVPSKENVYGELYGFVRFSNIRDVSKLLKAVNAVCFGNF